MAVADLDLGRYKLGWSDDLEYVFKPEKGLNEDVVDQMSWWKGEPEWMRQVRLRSLRLFERKPMAPWFAVNMPDLDFQDIYYYIKPTDHQVDEWDELPEQMKATYEKLGIPEAERKYLAGVTAQFESEVVYHRNREDLEARGILFCDMDTALREYPDLVKQYFGTVIPPGDNKFAALNTLGVVGRQLHLRAARGRVRDAAAGLLPHQRRERRPVRADADHRRRGRQGALHRGLLGAGVHLGLAALGGRRDRGQAQRPGDLHDHPELEPERLQPGHQAGPGRGGGPHGVDRRQHRLQAHDEVPLGLPGRPEGHGRGAERGLRRAGPAPGRRGQDDPRRSRDHVQDRVEVDLQGRRHHHLPRSRSGWTRAPTGARATCSATR